MPLLSYWDVAKNPVDTELTNKNSSIINEILDLLKFSGKLPNFTVDKNLPYGTSGEFNPIKYSIGFNPFTGNRASTMAHELTHALNYTMANDAFKWKNNSNKITKEKLAFIEALYKLKKPSFSSNDSYRDNREEQWGFGVGNFVDSPKTSWENDYSYPGIPHQDATNATEQAVLRDLYSRAIRSK